MESADEAVQNELRLGITQLDDHHQEFFSQVAGLRRALVDGAGGREKLMKTLRFLDRFVEEHFPAEERLMRLHNYPGILVHRQEHEKFEKTVTVFKQKALELDARGDVTSFLAMEVQRHLEDWLPDHIRKMDRKMADFLRDRL